MTTALAIRLQVAKVGIVINHISQIGHIVQAADMKPGYDQFDLYDLYDPFD